VIRNQLEFDVSNSITNRYTQKLHFPDSFSLDSSTKFHENPYSNSGRVNKKTLHHNLFEELIQIRSVAMMLWWPECLHLCEMLRCVLVYFLPPKLEAYWWTVAIQLTKENIVDIESSNFEDWKGGY